MQSCLNVFSINSNEKSINLCKCRMLNWLDDKMKDNCFSDVTSNRSSAKALLLL